MVIRTLGENMQSSNQKNSIGFLRRRGWSVASKYHSIDCILVKAFSILTTRDQEQDTHVYDEGLERQSICTQRLMPTWHSVAIDMFFKRETVKTGNAIWGFREGKRKEEMWVS
jgi:hypothetical protein